MGCVRVQNTELQNTLMQSLMFTSFPFPDDYHQQIEILPNYFDFAKVEELYPSITFGLDYFYIHDVSPGFIYENFDAEKIEGIVEQARYISDGEMSFLLDAALFELRYDDTPEYLHDVILGKYILALVRTDEDEILRERIVEFLLKFKSSSNADAILAAIALAHGEKVKLILPEVLQAYEGMDIFNMEDVCHARFLRIMSFNWHVWLLYYANGDYENADRINRERDDIFEALRNNQSAANNRRDGQP
jgi:hypothetical protein